MCFLRSESLYNNGFGTSFWDTENSWFFFKMAPPIGYWPKWKISKLEMLSWYRKITYLNYLETVFLRKYCSQYSWPRCQKWALKLINFVTLLFHPRSCEFLDMKHSMYEKYTVYGLNVKSWDLLALFSRRVDGLRGSRMLWKSGL